MTISIVKGTENVIALIGSIGTKQGDYRASVNSAVLSVVAHSIENNEISLVEKLLAEMYSNSYRDLKVVRLFLDSLTPILLEDGDKEGRKQKVKTSGKGLMKLEINREGKNAKEIGKLEIAALTKHNKRAEMFESFVKDEAIQVRNPAWFKGCDPSIDKTVGVQYHQDIFAYYEDVEYLRKINNKPEEIDGYKLLERDVFENMQDPIIKAMKAIEAVKVDERGDELKADLVALQAIADRVLVKVQAQEAKRLRLVEAAKLEKAGATPKQVADWMK
ncbi:UNVERIFIED_CONTAM: hypothetical protein RF648_19455, partial [Kocuria sp. CPCC 205274]